MLCVCYDESPHKPPFANPGRAFERDGAIQEDDSYSDT